MVPNIDPPRTPLAFMKPRPATPTSIPSKLTVNFVLPYASELANKEVSYSYVCEFWVPLWVFLIGFCGFGVVRVDPGGYLVTHFLICYVCVFEEFFCGYLIWVLLI